MSSNGFDKFADDLIEKIGSVAGSVGNAASEAASGVGRLKDFAQIGRDLVGSGAVTSHGGNLSVSDGKNIWITRTGTQLGHITADDIVTVEWEKTAADALASMELVVHRAMYHALSARLLKTDEAFGKAAIVHSHGLHSTFHSMTKDEIGPIDSEGRFVLGEQVPVIVCEQTIASEEVGRLMAGLVADGGTIAVIRSHGPFAIADSLQNAYRLVSCLEYSANMLTLFEQAGRTAR